MSQMKGTWDGEAHERVEAPLVYEPLRIPMWREGGTHEHDEDGSGAPAMVRLGRGTGAWPHRVSGLSTRGSEMPWWERPVLVRT